MFDSPLTLDWQLPDGTPFRLATGPPLASSARGRRREPQPPRDAPPHFSRGPRAHQLDLNNAAVGVTARRLVHASLLAAKEQRVLSEEEERLLLCFELRKAEASGTPIGPNDRAALTEFDPLWRARAARELRRWNDGRRSPREREAYRVLDANERLDEKRRRREALARQAEQLAQAERAESVRRWRRVETRRPSLQAHCAGRAEENAKLIFDAEWETAYSLSVEAAVRRVERGMVLSTDELNMLKTCRLVQEVKEGKVLTQEQLELLRSEATSWEAGGKQRMADRLYQNSTFSRPGSGRPPPNLKSATQRWMAVLTSTQPKGKALPSGMLPVQSRALHATLAAPPVHRAAPTRQRPASARAASD